MSITQLAKDLPSVLRSSHILKAGGALAGQGGGAVTKATIGLGDVDNTSDAGKPISFATQTALNGKASLAGADFTGAITVQAPTAGSHPATRSYVDTALAALVNSSPAALDTLAELAAALGGDASFAASTATALGNRLRLDTASQGLTSQQQSNAKANLSLVKADVGLGNADNTSDANKPVSTAQQTAINARASKNAMSYTPSIIGMDQALATINSVLTALMACGVMTANAAPSDVKLPFDPVVMIRGDSQAVGTPAAADQSAYVASYVADPMVQILSTDGTFKQYAPGSVAGQSVYSGTDSAMCGLEIGLIQRFRSLWPNNTLYIIKRGASGSTLVRKNSATGTVTGTISGNILTVTASAGGATFGAGSYLTGGTLPPRVECLFGTGTANQWYIGQTDSTANLALGTIASTTYTFYNYDTDWWNLDDGALYRNKAGATGSYKQWRTRATEALAALVSAGKNPKVVGLVDTLGTNDMAFSECASGFETAMRKLISQTRQDFPLLGSAPIILPRVRPAATYSESVRDAQLKMKGQGDVFVINTDDLSVHDGTHWSIGSLTSVGQRSADIMLGLSRGI